MTGNTVSSKPPTTRNMTGVISANPIVKRNTQGVATKVMVPVKANFVGEVLLHLSGDLATAYWSVTKGMRFTARATQTIDDEYDAGEFGILPTE